MISVIIRSHNDEEIIGRTLEILTRQKGCGEYELLSFDDGSTDRTPEIIRTYPEIKMFPKENLPYNPARVLNRAVQETKGEIVVFNNSDAVPLDEHFLANLTRPFAGDPAVGAVYANQLCRPDARTLVRKDYLRGFGDGKEAARWRHFFSLAVSAARREVLLAEPFDLRMQYSEDIEWSWRLKKQGKWKIVYAEDALAEHSHNYTLRQVWKRFYNEGIAEGQIYGEKSHLGTFLKHLVAESLRDLRFEIREGAWLEIPEGLVYRFLQKYAVHRGINHYLAKGKS